MTAVQFLLPSALSITACNSASVEHKPNKWVKGDAEKAPRTLPKALGFKNEGSKIYGKSNRTNRVTYRGR